MGGEDLGGDKGREAITRIQHMEKKSTKKRKEEEKKEKRTVRMTKTTADTLTIKLGKGAS